MAIVSDNDRGNPWHDPRSGKFIDAPFGITLTDGTLSILKSFSNDQKRTIDKLVKKDNGVALKITAIPESNGSKVRVGVIGKDFSSSYTLDLRTNVVSPVWSGSTSSLGAADGSDFAEIEDAKSVRLLTEADFKKLTDNLGLTNGKFSPFAKESEANNDSFDPDSLDKPLSKNEFPDSFYFSKSFSESKLSSIDRSFILAMSSDSSVYQNDPDLAVSDYLDFKKAIDSLLNSAENVSTSFLSIFSRLVAFAGIDLSLSNRRTRYLEYVARSRDEYTV